MEDKEITHFYNYLRYPKDNPYIERFNRTIQEEFINNNLDIIFDKEEFNKRLAEYLIFYNTEQKDPTCLCLRQTGNSLGLKSPLEYPVENGGMSQMCLTYTTK